MSLWQIVDDAVADVLASHPDYLTQKGVDVARKQIVRKVTAALRDSMSAPKAKPEDDQQPPEQPKPQHLTVMTWSKEWWAVFLARVESGQNYGWMLEYARTRNAPFLVPATEMPVTEDLAKFQNYPSDGSIWQRWSGWLQRKGVRMPEWRERHWVFLPSPDPPGESSQSAA